MKYSILFLVAFVLTAIEAQELKSPSEFLGYELGTQFTRHHEVVDYYHHLAAARPDQVKLITYGKTYERRPLLLAYISTASNIARLEDIRAEHMNNSEGNGNPKKAIVWLSYNVHGNESVSTEASMKTAHALLTEKSAYLENTVVIIDPCINPDGRDRYVNWYNQYKNTPYQPDPNSKEHHEGWWTGRSNHYMFDLNRDWAWLTQVESRQRLVEYQKWLPHVHVDFHEQGVNNPYYFAPAAEPYHEVITPFQRQFQETIGRNHAKYFDANGWFYFTKEVFDLLYPSYGDTYPMYSGGIGMTYEQGGSGRAGLGVITRIGDTLTLKDRIAHHYTTGLSTVEVAAANVDKLNAEFRKFYQPKNYRYRNYVLQGDEDKLSALKALLDAHQIKTGTTNSNSVKGYEYATGSQKTVQIKPDALVVPTGQKKATLVKVLFEPRAKLSDSVTYDITAWSLPYAYGLEAVATSVDLSFNEGSTGDTTPGVLTPGSGDYAYLTDWNSMKDARFLAALLKQDIRVRFAQKPFSLSGKTYARGSLIILRGDNKNHKTFDRDLVTISTAHQKSLDAVKTGFVDKGKDFGSSYVDMIPKVKVAVLSGGPTSTLRFGEIWHFFEQQLHYPLTVLDADYIDRVGLSNYDILILPGGWGYRDFMNDKRLDALKEWVAEGGRLIAMGGSIRSIDGEKGFAIKTKEQEKDSTDADISPYDNSEREGIKNAITGAIFKAKVDNTHPLGYGYGDTYYTLKLGSDSYDYLKQGTVAYLENSAAPVSGFAGSEAQKKMPKSLVFGVEQHGSGEVVYMVDNPLFRGFWENGKLFMANALFMIP